MLKKTVAAAFMTLMAVVAGAQAQSPKKINQFDAWAPYSYRSGKSTVCYVLSAPFSSAPSSVKHGENFFLISKRSNGKVYFEPQFMADYKLKPNSTVIVSVDGTDYDFFTRDSSAWIADASVEAKIIAAMRAGKNMQIQAVSMRGTHTHYNFSLKGLTAAMNAMKKCK